MKKLLFFTMCVLLGLMGHAQKPATISVAAAKDVYAKVALYKVINGRTEEIARRAGQFWFSLRTWVRGLLRGRKNRSGQYGQCRSGILYLTIWHIKFRFFIVCSCFNKTHFYCIEKNSIFYLFRVFFCDGNIFYLSI